MKKLQFVVITQQIEGSAETGFATYYYSDLKPFDSRDRAIRHGFEMGRSDDFNVGTVQDGRLVAFSWMDKDFGAGSGYELAEIEDQIHLRERWSR